MPRKPLAFATSVFAVCLMLFLQAASHASQTGYVYTTSSYVQNAAGAQVNICVYDYGDHQVGKVMITTLSGTLKALTMNVAYNNVVGKTCSDVTISGQSMFITTVNGVSVSTPSLYSAHIWKGSVNGVTSAWVQSEVWSVDGKTLLYATGPTWPALSSTPVKVSFLTLLPYLP